MANSSVWGYSSDRLPREEGKIEGSGQNGLKFRVGTDVGGTFTDVWVAANDGRTKTFKSPSTGDILTGVVDALEIAARSFGLELPGFCARIERFGHGTTVGLNALLTGRAAKTMVVTTAGFRDTLEIGRMKRQYAGLTELEVTDQYLRGRWPPQVARESVLEVPERIDSKGAVIQHLDEKTARRRLRRAAKDSVDALAICTLWSTGNPVHEKRLAEIAREELPGVFVCASHEICPAVGEYGRMSTTAVNAALGPVMSRYLSGMADMLGNHRMEAPVLVMTGAGGVVSAGAAAELPVSAVFSGPTAGVMGCQALASRSGKTNVLTIDVGGTSFDVGLIVEGKPLMRSETEVAGAAVLMPSIDVGSIGAGGGSIAKVSHGNLDVGPQSAGADPGPACYGRGGRLPTATDADLVLGTLDPDNFLGGRMPLDTDAARRAIDDHVAKPLGYSITEAAWGIRRVFESRMADLLRRVTIERGHDPREFTMFASGGAGPAHAWSLCRDIGVGEFVVPATATAQSAFGTGICDLRHSAQRAVYLRIGPGGEVRTANLADLIAACGEADEEVREALSLDAVPFLRIEVERSIGTRYLGQTHQLDVPFAEAEVTGPMFAACIDRFEEMYESMFGRGSAFRHAGFEVSYVRATGTGVLEALPDTVTGEPLTSLGSRPVVFDDPRRPVETPVMSVEYPASGQRIDGPGIVEFPGHTVVVPPGGTARTDEFGSLHVRLGK